jgi:hypothetical protein
MLDVLGIAAAVELGLGKDRLDVLGDDAVEDRLFRLSAFVFDTPAGLRVHDADDGHARARDPPAVPRRAARKTEQLRDKRSLSTRSIRPAGSGPVRIPVWWRLFPRRISRQLCRACRWRCCCRSTRPRAARALRAAPAASPSHASITRLVPRPQISTAPVRWKASAMRGFLGMEGCGPDSDAAVRGPCTSSSYPASLRSVRSKH